VYMARRQCYSQNYYIDSNQIFLNGNDKVLGGEVCYLLPCQYQNQNHRTTVKKITELNQLNSSCFLLFL